MADAPPPAPPPEPEDDDETTPWGRPAAAPPPRPAARGDDRPAYAPPPAPPGRGAQLAAALLALCALGGIVVALLTYVQPATEAVLVAVPVSQYRHIDWAANSSADFDADRLAAHFAKAERANAEQEGRRLREFLESLRSRADRRPVVVYLSALAAEREGAVYVVPGDAHADNPDEWVPVQDVLDALTDCRAPAKALILDLGRPLASPFWGPLADDVPRALDEQLAGADLRFPVLTSCGPGERSHFRRDAGGSAFAAYLADGASGLADGAAPPHDRDGRVTFDELAEFTANRVAQWADRTLGVRQAPVRYGPSAGGIIVALKGRPEPPAPPTAAAPDAPPPPPPPEPDYPAELAAAWAKRDAALAAGRFAPPRLTEAGALLLRAEARVGADGKLPADALTKLPELLGRLDAPPEPFGAGTLWEKRAGRPAPPGELVAAFEKWRDARSGPMPNPKADEAEQALDKLAAGKSVDLAGVIWDRALADRTPTPARVKQLADLLTAGPFAAEPPPASRELLLLRQLAATPGIEEAYPAGVRQLLRAEQALAEATALAGPASSAVADAFGRADAAKRAAEKALLTPNADPAERDRAARQMADAAALLELVAQRGRSRVGAADTLARSARALHGTLPGVADANAPDFRLWRAAAEGATALADRLADPSADPAALAAADDAQRGRLAELLAPFTAPALPAARDAASKTPRPETVRAASLLLHSDALPSAERVPLARAAWKGGADLLRALQADLEEKQDRGTGTPPPSRPAVVAEEDAARARRRAEASLALLRLGGHAKAAEAEELHRKAMQARSESAPWLALEARLRAAWGKELPAEAAAALAAGDGARAERAALALPAGAGATTLTLRPAAEAGEAARRARLAALFADYRMLRERFRPAGEFFDHLAWEARR